MPQDKGASLNILDILGEIKYIIKINLTCFFLLFFDVATKNMEMMYVAGIVFLLDSTVLQYSPHSEIWLLGFCNTTHLSSLNAPWALGLSLYMPYLGNLRSPLVPRPLDPLCPLHLYLVPFQTSKATCPKWNYSSIFSLN